VARFAGAALPPDTSGNNLVWLAKLSDVANSQQLSRQIDGPGYLANFAGRSASKTSLFLVFCVHFSQALRTLE
jgi:hypothetical protein